MKHLMGRTRKIIHFLWGDWLILCANPSMQIGQFFVRGMHQWIPAAAMSSQPTVCLLVVVRMASDGFWKSRLLSSTVFGSPKI